VHVAVWFVWCVLRTWLFGVFYVCCVGSGMVYECAVVCSVLGCVVYVVVCCVCFVVNS
jgi:hypothetical protein